MKQFTRRTFIKSAIATAISAGFMPGCATSRVRGRIVGPNEEIRFAVVGFRGRGADHIRSILSLREKGEKVRLVALCDADRNILESGVKSMREKGVNVQGYVDIRDLLASNDIDAVTFATPNHWHALGTIWAVQAG
ncbi:MAG: Gfo/Idh/MocA family oxidoreductase, partial [Verrucomicrobiae bacterium]|nr:Gfo/Idh/MocA family oxidoreductase [Verrucomicrobiae bacterium]